MRTYNDNITYAIKHDIVAVNLAQINDFYHFLPVSFPSREFLPL